MAELIGAAMLGPVTTEMNWLQICIDTSIYRQADAFQSVAEDILRELRECPPAPGFDSVEVPGERERDRRRINESGGVLLPMKTWQQIVALAARLGVSVN